MSTPTKCPPPIRPNVGSYVYREPRPRKSDWAFWREIPAPQLWQLVALSCDIEPNKCNPPWGGSGPLSNFARDDETFRRRYAITLENADAFTPRERYAEEGAWKVSAAQFVAWAKDRASFQPMPSELVARGGQPEPAAPPVSNAAMPAPAHSPVSLDPLTYAQLGNAFGCPVRGHNRHRGARSHDCWQRLSRNAKDNGLIAARVTVGSGPTPSTFDPLRVARWLIKEKRQSPNAVIDELSAIIPEGTAFTAIRAEAKAMKRPEPDAPNGWGDLAAR